ncbi:MAG TPA: sigma factor-like helix-turn-helix DNA-binding protein [Candidatus Paceibacterota bacterium]
MTKITARKLNFKPGTAVKALLAPVQDRARDIVERRFGITGKTGDRMTLEAIGEIYNITRERVRQIENFALESIRKSDAYTKNVAVFEELEDYLTSHGGLIKEETLLNELGKDEQTRNQVVFLLTLGESFVRLREDDDYYHRWTLDPESADKVHGALDKMREGIGADELIAESEIVDRLATHLKNDVGEYVSNEQARRWLDISKHISSNPLNEWGHADSPNVKTRGVRDYAYLVLRKHGKPLHFSEVAEQVTEMFGRPAHVATTHNELIKDERFVLVGRGLYALSEWGYSNGVVRDVIRTILKEKGPMTKEELTKEVLKQRQVKENTIYVNLQNARHFRKDVKGRYTPVA